MDSLSFSKNRPLLPPASAGDMQTQDFKKSFPNTLTPMETEHANLNTSMKNPGELEIPSLDEMASYLISNESIGKELLQSHMRQHSEMPGLEAEYELNPSVSTRAREKSDSGSLTNQSNSDDMKKEVESLYKKAQILCSGGEFQQAINYYNRIISLNEKSGSAWVAKGHCYGMMGLDSQALATYETALKVSPSCQKDEQLWYGLGNLYLKAGELNNAEISFRNALRLEPKLNLKAEIFHSLGTLLKSKGEYAESIKMLTNAILTGVFPPEKMIEILCQNGNLQEKINDLEGALKTYQYAIMIQDNHFESLLHAGWLCFKLDKIDQALSHMTKAESLTPNNGNIIYVIARCYLKLKQHTTAYDFLHKAISKDPVNSIFWASLGILFSELMQLKQAHESFSKALNLGSSCPENFFNLGCLFELANQFNDAISMYDKAIELQPDFVLAVNRRKKLLTDTKIASLEVQFKHPPFTFPFPKDTSAEKALTLPQPGTLNRQLGDNSNLMEGPKPKARKEDMRLFDSSDQDFNLKPVPLDLLASKLGPQKAISESGYPKPLGPDVSSMTLSRPKGGESSRTKLPSVQALSSSIDGLNSFSILQNNYNNVNNFLINPVLDYAKQLNSENHNENSLLPNRSKTDELALKGGATDLAKHITGLQEILSKNNTTLQSQTMSIESLRASKNISSPIVLKHNPQLLGAGSTAKRIEGLSDARSQLRNLPRIGRDDNDEEPVVQKRLKVQTFSKVDLNPPTEN